MKCRINRETNELAKKHAKIIAKVRAGELEQDKVEQVLEYIIKVSKDGEECDTLIDGLLNGKYPDFVK